MKTYTAAELAEIIESHGKWLRGEDGGSRANLYGADLYGADLRCMGNMHNIKTIQADIWPVGYTHDTLQIGCQRHLIAEWQVFSDEEIGRMDSRALSWWEIWKPILMNIIEVSPANPTKVDGDE